MHKWVLTQSLDHEAMQWWVLSILPEPESTLEAPASNNWIGMIAVDLDTPEVKSIAWPIRAEKTQVLWKAMPVLHLNIFSEWPYSHNFIQCWIRLIIFPEEEPIDQIFISCFRMIE